MTQTLSPTTGKSDNELIAEFMGLVRPDGYVRSPIPSDQNWYAKPKFDTSWDWLMPVWYKFKSLIFADYKQAETHSKYKQIIKHAILNDGVEVACKELADGIKWYNSQTKES